MNFVIIFDVLLVFAFVGVIYANPLTHLRDIEFGYPEGRIVGGHDAEPHSAPWIISLQYVTNTSRHICGGSIIANDWIMTAAHCLVGLPPGGRLEVSAGRHNISDPREVTEQRRTIERVIVHEQYTGGVGPFDIGLIHLNASLNFNGAVQAINLPLRNNITSGNVQLNGWGSTSRTLTPALPAILQTIVKPILNYRTCRLILGASSPLRETNLCTGPITGGVSACSGDSGGPLVQDGQVVGIVSWGRIPCGVIGAPSVYTRVSAYIDWIANAKSSISP